MLEGVLAVLSGYLLGSIPAAYLVGKLKGYDMHQHADGSLGASLTFRKLGPVAGLAVGLVDFSKGFLSIIFALLLHVPFPVVLLAGLASVTGHNWSIMLGFKGGGGSMTSYGVLAVLMLWELLVALVFGAVVLYFYTEDDPFHNRSSRYSGDNLVVTEPLKYAAGADLETRG